MSLYSLLGTIIFLLAYLYIALEHKLKTHKSGIALAFGGILWILVAASGVSPKILAHEISETGAEIFSLIVFLLSAMTLVEILVHYRFFDLIRIKLFKLGLSDRQQFVVISFLTFFLSAVLDNLTVTIVMIQIARRFFKGENLSLTVASIVIMANAGGAWSPIGDVTTIMIWLAGKFSALEIISWTFLPALALGLTSLVFFSKKIKGDTKDIEEEKNIVLTRGEKLIIASSLGSFGLPLFMNNLGLPPYMGLLFGLGVTWVIIENLKQISNHHTHLKANIDEFLQKTDIASLKFFIGILLSVSALKILGVLENLSFFLFGQNQEVGRIILGNILLGPMSAVIDNVPLTAIALDIIKVSSPSLWTLLALTVGTGGSLLVIGSAAGVIAMGIIKELTFAKYLKIATLPATVGYFVAIAVWLMQYLFFR